MLRLSKLYVALASTIILMLGLTGATLAQQNQQNQTKNQIEIIDKSIYRFGDSININNIVNGDIYCTGNNINIDGIIEGDIICAGQNITINATVNGNVRVVGANVKILGNISDSATVFAQTFTSTPDSKVGIDASVFASNVELHGAIERDLNIRASDVVFSGTVGRNLQSFDKSFIFDEDARVGGNFTYSSPNQTKIPDGAVKGSVTHDLNLDNNATRKEYFLSNSVFLMSFVYIAWFLALIVAALGVALLFPKSLDDAVVYGKKQPIATIVAGGLAIFVTPLILLVLFVSIVGIPLGLILGFLFGAGLLLSGPFMAHYLGYLLFPYRSHPIRSLAGSVILLIVYAIPIINILAVMAVIVYGSGMVFRVATNRYSIARKNYKSS